MFCSWPSPNMHRGWKLISKWQCPVNISLYVFLICHWGNIKFEALCNMYFCLTTLNIYLTNKLLSTSFKIIVIISHEICTTVRILVKFMKDQKQPVPYYEIESYVPIQHLQRRLASAAKKAISKIPQRTVKTGDKVRPKKWDRFSLP